MSRYVFEIIMLSSVRKSEHWERKEISMGLFTTLAASENRLKPWIDTWCPGIKNDFIIFIAQRIALNPKSQKRPKQKMFVRVCSRSSWQPLKDRSDLDNIIASLQD